MPLFSKIQIIFI